MEHSSSSLNLPVSDLEMKMVGLVSNNPVSNHFFVSKEQMDLVVPVSNSPGANTSVMQNSQVGHNVISGYNPGPSPFLLSNTVGYVSGDKAFLPVKRKADLEPLMVSSSSQQALPPIKRPSNMGGSTRLIQPSPSQRKASTIQSKLVAPGLQAQPLVDKKLMQSKSTSGGKDGSEAVRSKMRESLIAALSLVDMRQHKVLHTQGNQMNSSNPHQTPVDSKVSESKLATSGLVVGCPSEEFSSKGSDVVGATNDCRGLSDELPTSGNRGDVDQAFQDFQYGSILPDEDNPFGDSFFPKDDLLQGNGLSWAFDFDVQMREGLEAQTSEKLKPVEEEIMAHTDRSVVEMPTPKNVAVKIESELFKLFGGVNKKYKEKGRSLLFNLKDRNNPELRERVMSGEISPEKLCSMSAEDLASKELSEWRMAKAEEMAQMVVLPDTEVDIRRLVKKTHKGEYQLEIEHDDGVSAEISGGNTVVTQLQPQKKIETNSPSIASPKDKSNASGQKSSENQDFSGSLIIPTDGADLMQGMMVDELKDAEFLPPIVSLDEFMESLNSEPPFENLSPHAVDKTLVTHKEIPKVVVNSRATNHALVSPKYASPKNSDVVKKLEVVNEKLSGNPPKQKFLPSFASRVNYIWEGMLQLNTSISINVGGVFQSGEKTSTKEWPNSLEIKGRVRLDSFEKFLRELPLSRTRAVMVLQFVLGDKSSETPHSSLSEAIDSFAADERLGYAEPSAGVELYLCPPASRMANMINEHMPKKQSETDNTIENGLLIGVVVWRKAHKTNIVSPNNSSSDNKHSLKKLSLDPPKKIQDSSNVNVKVNVNAQTRAFTSASTNVARPTPQMPTPDEDGDIPPGFGPMSSARAAKDDDDLPEFSFSGHLNPSTARVSPQDLQNRGVNSAQRSVDQVRELIKKYGQSGGGTPSRSMVDNRSLSTKPWHDDNDIPEWQPELPDQLLNQPYHVAQSYRQSLQVPLPHQRVADFPGQQPHQGWEGTPPSGGWQTHQFPPAPPQRDGRWKRY